MTRVKICGITREEDALAAARSGADAIGLVFYKHSPRQVNIELAVRLVDALPPFVSVVGLFVNADTRVVHDVLNGVPLDLLQFHGDESPEYCAQFGKAYLKAIRVKKGVDLLQYEEKYATAKALLLDAHVEGMPGGTGTTFDWKLIPGNLSMPVILSGGLDVENVATAIKLVQPYAVDVSSGVEADKGVKDAVKIARFMQEVKKADV